MISGNYLLPITFRYWYIFVLGYHYYNNNIMTIFPMTDNPLGGFTQIGGPNANVGMNVFCIGN